MSEEAPINRVRNRIEKYKELEQWDKAALEYQNLIGFLPFDPEIQKQAGDAYLKANQGLTAIKFYLNAAQMYEN